MEQKTKEEILSEQTGFSIKQLNDLSTPILIKPFDIFMAMLTFEKQCIDRILTPKKD